MMDRPTNETVMAQLAREGLWDTGRAEETRTVLTDHLVHEAPHPWYIRLIAAAGAWGAALSVMGLLGLLGVIGSSGLCVGLGVVTLGASVALRRATGEGGRTFPIQLALAGAIAGQLLFLGGMTDIFNHEGILLVAAAMYAVLLVFYPDHLGRFLATYGCCVSLGIWLHEVASDLPLHLLSSVFFFIAVWLMDDEAALERGALAQLRAPLATGLLGAMFSLLIFGLIDWDTQGQLTWLTSMGLSLGVCFLGVRVFRELPQAERPGPASRVGLLAVAAILGALTWSVPGVIAAIGALLLGFHCRDRVVAGAACLFLTGFLVFFYYDMDMTLLNKSFVLMASGGLLLGVRALIPSESAVVDLPDLKEVFE